MPRPKKEDPIESARRSIKIHAAFQPDGTTLKDVELLMELWSEVQDHLILADERELVREEKEWSELKQAIEKLSPLFESVLKGDRAASAASVDASELVPEKALRKKVFDWYTEILSRKPEETEQADAELKVARAELNVRSRIQDHKSSITRGIESLCKSVETDGLAAAEVLLEVATYATFHLMLATRTHPEIMKEVAAMNSMWPVIAKEEPGWEKIATDQVIKLELGKGLTRFKTPLRRVRGSDIHLPARRWAKAAVHAIDETRWKAPFFLHMVKKLGGSDEWAAFSVMHGWDLADYPSWVSSATKLEPLSVNTFDSWKAVIREIIREQVADFHLLPEWATQRMTAEANGRNTPGQIQNAILDDIVSALKRLVP